MSGLKYKAQRGMADQLPSDIRRWQQVQSLFQTTVEPWGYDEIRTPILEDKELFIRTSGDTSEVVTKQMYDFLDKGDRWIALRPEGTAGVMRAIIENGLLQPGAPLRLWYFNQHFRYERPQKGRYRQHHQLGMELIGSTSPRADAEIIEVSFRFFQALGLSSLKALVNCIGRSETRVRFREAVVAHIQSWLTDQTEENRARALANPLRLFDSKDEAIQALMADAPLVTDHLEDASRAHFDGLQEALTEAGVPYELDPRIVRGLDYYTDTVFEVLSTSLGSQSAVCGGGRYDGLIEAIGGPATPSVGVGIGVERLLIILEAHGLMPPPPAGAIALVAPSPESMALARSLATRFRAAGRRVVLDLESRGFKQQFKLADKLGASHALILGDEELASGQASVKDLESGEQKTLALEEAVAWLLGS